MLTSALLAIPVLIVGAAIIGAIHGLLLRLFQTK